jgi:hypothetical protein
MAISNTITALESATTSVVASASSQIKPKEQETPSIWTYGRKIDVWMHGRFGLKTTHLVYQIALALPFYALTMCSPIINFTAVALTVACLNWTAIDKSNRALTTINDLFQTTSMMVLISVALKCTLLFFQDFSIGYLALTTIFGIGSYCVYRTLKLDYDPNCCPEKLAPQKEQAPNQAENKPATVEPKKA